MDLIEEPLAVVHLHGRSRFEARRGDRRVATLDYRISGAAAVLTDTRVTAGEDRAGTSSLIGAALDALARSGFYAVALCPHVRAFLREHPERHGKVDVRFLDPVGTGARAG